MKRPVFCCILILVFLAACVPGPEEADILADGDRAAGQNLTKITVYLDEREPPAQSQSRAINKALAQMGCDYFEVVFVGNKDGALVTALGQWRIGERAGVKDVYRTPAGVDYGGVSPSPASGTGSALLLAGKSDKTMMAIGKLSADTKLINSNTEFVTFELAAIKAGISESSFRTAALGSPPSDPGEVSIAHTDIDNDYTIADISFQAFRLPSGSPDVRAEYRFELDAGVTFATYTAGLFVSGNGGTAYKKRPSYTMADGYNIASTTAVPSLDVRNETTVVKMTNNQTGEAFDPVVRFTFNTSSSGVIVGSVFALVFQVPIYALVPECAWYVRPGYGVLNYELDDGTGGMGGAVLIKIGNATPPNAGSTDFKIRITRPPAKWRYRWANTAESSDSINPLTTGDSGNPVEEYDRVFRIGPFPGVAAGSPGSLGMEVQKFRVDGTTVMNDFQGGAYVGTDNGDTNIIPYDLLTFIIGEKELQSNAPGNYVLPDIFYGLIEVTVKHTNNALISATDKFFILVSGNYRYTPHAQENNYLYTSHYDYANLNDMTTTLDRSNITDANGLTTILNTVENYPNVIQIIKLGASFDIVSKTMQTNGGTPGNSRLIMFVSTVDNLVLGRSGSGAGGASLTFSGDNSGLTAFYFGKWPFEGLKNSPTSLNNNSTKDFRINAGGTYSAYGGAPSINSDLKMLIDTNVPRGGIYNVYLGKGTTAHPLGMLH